MTSLVERSSLVWSLATGDSGRIVRKIDAGQEMSVPLVMYPGCCELRTGLQNTLPERVRHIRSR